MRNKITVVVLSFIFGLLMSPIFVHAEFYKWVDDKGDIHFTDEYANIPEKYLSVVETRKTPIERSLPSIDKKPAPEPSSETPKPVEEETSSVFRGMISEIDQATRTIVVVGAGKTMIFSVPEDTTIRTDFGKHFLFTELRTGMSVSVEHIPKAEGIHTLNIKIESMPSGFAAKQEPEAKGNYEAPKYKAPQYKGPQYKGPKYERPKYKAPKR